MRAGPVYDSVGTPVMKKTVQQIIPLLVSCLLAACGGDDSTAFQNGLNNSAASSLPLRQAADRANFNWGAAATVLREDALGNPAYDAALAGNFNMTTAENELKLPFLRAPDGTYNFEPADRIADFARAHGMKMHGHVLVWREDLTPWLGENPTREDGIAFMRDHISTVLGHYRDNYPDVFTQWDVVNEAYRSDGTLRASGWQQVIGDDFIELAFQFADEAWPELTLFYNDFYELNFNFFGSLLDAGGNPDPDAIRPGAGPNVALSTCETSLKCLAVQAMAEDFVARSVPMDAVGFQAHIPNAFAPDYATFAEWVGPLGLEWIITELDAPCPNDDSANESCFNTQADIFRAVVQACVDDPACATVVQWGVADGYSWWPGLSAGSFGRPLALDFDFNYKPAANAVLEVLQGR